MATRQSAGMTELEKQHLMYLAEKRWDETIGRRRQNQVWVAGHWRKRSR
jgi:hypothetical protein